MATEAQINANRENAKKSTGAKTEAGQQASSQNRTTHGLRRHNCHDFFLLEDEDPQKYEELADYLIEEFKPETQAEHIIVRNMIHHDWLRARALRFQHCWFDPEGGFVTTDGLQVFMRYEGHHERAFYRAVRELQNLRKETRNTEIGFERQKIARSAEHRAIQTLELKKQTFELKKEELQIRKMRVRAASAGGSTVETAQTPPEPSPGGQKMAA